MARNHRDYAKNWQLLSSCEFIPSEARIMQRRTATLGTAQLLNVLQEELGDLALNGIEVRILFCACIDVDRDRQVIVGINDEPAHRTLGGAAMMSERQDTTIISRPGGVRIVAPPDGVALLVDFTIP